MVCSQAKGSDREYLVRIPSGLLGVEAGFAEVEKVFEEGAGVGVGVAAEFVEGEAAVVGVRSTRWA